MDVVSNEQRERINRHRELPELQDVEALIGDRSLPWHRLLVRSGFRVDSRLNGEQEIRLTKENAGNLRYLSRLLAELGLKNCLQGQVLSPPVADFSEAIWLQAWERLHCGAEGGAGDVDHFELMIMDTYIAGFVRWINDIGLKSTYSCDGHGRAAPCINMATRTDAHIAHQVLRCIAPAFARPHELHRNRLLFRPHAHGAEESPTYPLNHTRVLLLELGERIYGLRDQLRQMVQGYKLLIDAEEAIEEVRR